MGTKQIVKDHNKNKEGMSIYGGFKLYPLESEYIGDVCHYSPGEVFPKPQKIYTCFHDAQCDVYDFHRPLNFDLNKIQNIAENEIPIEVFTDNGGYPWLITKLTN